MKFCLVELFCNGVRRPREEVRQQRGNMGELTVSDWHEGNASRRTLRVAHFRERYGGATIRDIVVPLFDPQLVRMTGTGFVLRGWQYHSEDGVLHEWMQEWWIRPAGIVGKENSAGSSSEPVAVDHGHHVLERI